MRLNVIISIVNQVCVYFRSNKYFLITKLIINIYVRVSEHKRWS